jgi:WD40 repeat protein
MLVTHFNTSHDDLVHDVAYDYYGKRLVTCSSDQKIKVWDWVEESPSSANASSSHPHQQQQQSFPHHTQHPHKQLSLQHQQQQQQQQNGKWVLNDTWKVKTDSLH